MVCIDVSVLFCRLWLFVFGFDQVHKICELGSSVPVINHNLQDSEENVNTEGHLARSFMAFSKL
jgi:hypothetical protein